MKLIARLVNYIKTKPEKSGLVLVILVACCLSIASFLYYYNNGLTLAYGDSKAHLTISRRVFSSLTPGFTQLGAIWLPLPHILSMATIWNDFMFYSGLSGSLVSMAAYIGAAVVIYKSVFYYTKNIGNALLGAFVLLLNPSYLYLQSTPMTESLSLATLLVAIYLLIRWAKNNNPLLLIGAAFVTSLSTLTRYDNWSLLPAAVLAIIFVGLLGSQKRLRIEANVVLYITLASFGIFLWMLYNLLIFGNALNFALGEGSASWYAKSQHSNSVHQPAIAFLTYIWTAIDTVGFLALTVTGFGIAFFALKNRISKESIPAYLFLVPVAFNIVSLYLGQSIMFTTHLDPYTLYNSRYGINALPAVAFFIAIIPFGKRWIRGIIIAQLLVLLLLQHLYLYSRSIVVLDEVGYGTKQVNVVASKWVRENPVEGYTLLSDLSLASLLGFDGHIPQDKLITEASGEYWRIALKNPEKNSQRVIMSKQFNGDDILSLTLGKSKTIKDNYHLVFDQDNIKIYDRKW